MENRLIGIRVSGFKQQVKIVAYLESLGARLDYNPLGINGYIWVNELGCIYYKEYLPSNCKEIYLPNTKVAIKSDGTLVKQEQIIKYLISLGGKENFNYQASIIYPYYLIYKGIIHQSMGICKGYTLIDLPEPISVQKKPIIITPLGAKNLFAIVPWSWKDRIAELWGKQILLGQDIEMSEDLYQEIFGNKNPYPIKGTLYLVRAYEDNPWMIARADGNGHFDVLGGTGEVKNFAFEIPFDLDNIPK